VCRIKKSNKVPSLVPAAPSKHRPKQQFHTVSSPPSYKMAASSNVLPGSTDKEKLDALCQRTFQSQAIWFLNSFWETFAEAEAENLWNYVHKAQEIDLDHKVA
jgi:hypothetical protein